MDCDVPLDTLYSDISYLHNHNDNETCHLLVLHYSRKYPQVTHYSSHISIVQAQYSILCQNENTVHKHAHHDLCDLMDVYAHADDAYVLKFFQIVVEQFYLVVEFENQEIHVLDTQYLLVCAMSYTPIYFNTNNIIPIGIRLNRLKVSLLCHDNLR